MWCLALQETRSTQSLGHLEKLWSVLCSCLGVKVFTEKAANPLLTISGVAVHTLHLYDTYNI